ncbi:MAG TPA: phage Gp37/Gp68 family protein [Gammaproteobacteria bacterium]|nr:phage Gp37/Gp68 family protein [Gammaproteobacteria bacterium]
MGDKSAIEWTDATWNPITGCSRVSEGCRHCYAERFAHRFSAPGQRYEGLTVLSNGHPTWTGKIQFNEKALLLPLRWKRPRRVFVNSMSDLFHEHVTDEQRDRIFAVMGLTPWHTYQILTKRPGEMRDYIASRTMAEMLRKDLEDYAVEYAKSPCAAAMFDNWPLRNVWLGVSVEDQPAADDRVPLLLQTPAAVRFLSCEPLLGPLGLSKWIGVDFAVNTRDCEPMKPRTAELLGKMAAAAFRHAGGAAVDWVIVGGESGPGARPMHPDWARSLRDQCQAAGVPFFFKQWGEWAPKPRRENLPGKPTMYCTGDALLTREGKIESYESCGGIGNHAVMERAGKKAAGALLDGREWKQYPEAR